MFCTLRHGIDRTGPSRAHAQSHRVPALDRSGTSAQQEGDDQDRNRNSNQPEHAPADGAILTPSISAQTTMAAVLRGGLIELREGDGGRNLMTWSKYTKVGYDPEVQQVARSLAVESTWELWAYPSSRNFYFTVDVGF